MWIILYILIYHNKSNFKYICRMLKTYFILKIKYRKNNIKTKSFYHSLHYDAFKF